MATANEVKAQREKVEALRKQVADARAAAVSEARSGENDARMSALSNEEQMLQQELARLTGANAAAPAPAPAPAETTTKVTSTKGDTSGQEG